MSLFAAGLSSLMGRKAHSPRHLFLATSPISNRLSYLSGIDTGDKSYTATDVSSGPSVGHILLGCGPRNVNLTTFQVMESSELER